MRCDGIRAGWRDRQITVSAAFLARPRYPGDVLSMRVAVHAVSIASIIVPGILCAQESARSPTAVLAVASWSGTFSATFADTTTSDGEVRVQFRSVQGTVRFSKPRRRGTTAASWSGTGAGDWRVDDRITTPVPRGSEVTQTMSGQGTAPLDERRTSLRVDTGRHTYDLTLALEPFQVDLVTEGGTLDEPMRTRTRPPRGGGLAGSVRGAVLPATGLLLEGNQTLQDGTVLRWSFAPAGGVQTAEHAEPPPAPAKQQEVDGPPPAPPAAPAESTLPQLSMNRPGRGESGTSWFEDRWERSYTVAVVEVIPPEREKDFKGLDHTLVIKVMGDDGGWITIAEAPVKPGPVSGMDGWQKDHPVQLNPDYFVIRLVKSLTEPMAARGIRFELQGARVLGGGWTFWVRSAPQPDMIGETRYEWKYTHAW